MDKIQTRDIIRKDRRKQTLAAAAAVGLCSDSKNANLYKLIGLLRNSDSIIRQRAIEGLGQLRGNDATTYIVRALEDPSNDVRIMACKTLGQMRAHTAKMALYDLTNDDDTIMQCCAAESLMLMGDNYGLPTIKKLLKKRGEHQLPALRCLNKMTGKNFRLTASGIQEAIRWMKPKKRRFFSIN